MLRSALPLATLFAFSAGAVVALPTTDATYCLHPIDDENAGFGLALATLDWDDDGRDEIAWGGWAWDVPGSLSSDHGLFRSYEIDSGAPSGFELEGLHNGGSGGDQLGRALAVGDFDGDGLDEIAIGASSAGVGGQVIVLEHCLGICFGVQLGITLDQDAPDVAGGAEEGDFFGFSLAAGDFDGDGYDDLAVGVPYEEWSGVEGESHGAVQLFYGSEDGLDGARDLLFGQHAFTGQTREAGDLFGWALVAGDVDGDGDDDLAIGVPFEDEGSVADSGVVHVVFGSRVGIDFARQQTWSQSSLDDAGSPEVGDQFGWALVLGDFNRDPAQGAINQADLAIAARCEDVGDISCAGGVHVLRSGLFGPIGTGSQFFTRPGGSLEDGRFGDALMAADFDGDGASDLAISAYKFGIDSLLDSEVFFYLGQSDDQLRFSGREPWHAADGVCLIPGASVSDLSRRALVAGDFNADGIVDLGIGLGNWTDDENVHSKGAVEILYGSLFTDGFDTGDAGRWSATAP